MQRVQHRPRASRSVPRKTANETTNDTNLLRNSRNSDRDSTGNSQRRELRPPSFSFQTRRNEKPPEIREKKDDNNSFRKQNEFTATTVSNNRQTSNGRNSMNKSAAPSYKKRSVSESNHENKPNNTQFSYLQSNKRSQNNDLKQVERRAWLAEIINNDGSPKKLSQKFSQLKKQDDNNNSEKNNARNDDFKSKKAKDTNQRPSKDALDTPVKSVKPMINRKRRFQNRKEEDEEEIPNSIELARQRILEQLGKRKQDPKNQEIPKSEPRRQEFRRIEPRKSETDDNYNSNTSSNTLNNSEVKPIIKRRAKIDKDRFARIAATTESSTSTSATVSTTTTSNPKETTSNPKETTSNPKETKITSNPKEATSTASNSKETKITSNTKATASLATSTVNPKAINPIRNTKPGANSTLVEPPHVSFGDFEPPPPKRKVEEIIIPNDKIIETKPKEFVEPKPTSFTEVVRFPPNFFKSKNPDSNNAQKKKQAQNPEMDEFLLIESKMKDENDDIGDSIPNFYKILNILRSNLDTSQYQQVVPEINKNRTKHFILLLSQPLKSIDAVYLLRGDLKFATLLWGLGPKKILRKDVDMYYIYNITNKIFEDEQIYDFEPNLDAISLKRRT